MNNKVPEDIDDKVNAIYQEAVDLKEIARKSPENIQFYIQAAELLHEVGEICANLIETEQNIDKRIQYEALSSYYFYEEQDCLAGHYYEKRDIENANSHRQNSEKFIANAINVLKNIPEHVSPEIKERLIKLLPSWEYHQQSDTVSKLGNEARAAWDGGQFIEALDIYRKLAEFQETIIQNFDENLEPKYKRITMGNFIGSMVNASSAMVMLIQESCKEDRDSDFIELSFDRLVKLLKYSMDAYLLGESAFHENPEWQQYYEFAQHCLKNIKSTLLLNLDVWKQLYMAFEDNPDYLKIMKMTDPDKFNVAEGLSSANTCEQSSVSTIVEYTQTQEKSREKEDLTDIATADSLYEKVILKHPLTEEFKKSREKETEIRQDIEIIDAAIKLYGTTSSDKVVVLRQTKEELESLLPQSPSVVSENFWKNFSRWFSNSVGISPNTIIFVVVIIFAAIFLIPPIIATIANVLKINDSIVKEQASNENKNTKIINTPTIQLPIQTPASSNINTVNANLPESKKQEEVKVTKGQSVKAIGGKVIISLSGIVFEKNIGNALVDKATGTIGEVGKKSVSFVKKEVGYSMRLTVDRKDYEIRLIKMDTFDATFVITNITK